jgi:hypothetical protein
MPLAIPLDGAELWTVFPENVGRPCASRLGPAWEGLPRWGLEFGFPRRARYIVAEIGIVGGDEKISQE